VRGLVQALNPPPSSWHWKVKLAGGVTLSDPVKVKVAEVLLLGLVGLPVIVVSGGVVSFSS
jgi:hypothetical protein